MQPDIQLIQRQEEIIWYEVMVQELTRFREVERLLNIRTRKLQGLASEILARSCLFLSAEIRSGSAGSPALLLKLVAEELRPYA